MLSVLSTILDFLFPPVCLGCRREGMALCDSCLVGIQLQQSQVCPVCKKSSSYGVVHEACSNRTKLDGLIVAAEYSENRLLQKSIRHLKYRYNTTLAESLGKLLWKILQRYPDVETEETLLVPVPLHARRQRWRGFNQAELLARSLGEESGIPMRMLLKRVRHTQQQARLGRSERLKNMIGAFTIDEEKVAAFGKELSGMKVFLIDDVASTGSTLEAAAEVLKEEGVKQVIAVVLGRG